VKQADEVARGAKPRRSHPSHRHRHRPAGPRAGLHGLL